MLTDDPRIAALARAVLDGTDVDWPAVTSETAADARPVVQELRLLAALGAVHRRPASGDAASNETPAWFAPLLTESHPAEWGHLHVRALLGRGAAGAVYRAWDSRLDRDVALKLLPVPAGGRSGAPSTFIEEGRLLARVRHPNVVTIHGAEQIGGEIGLWMELVDGRTLETIVPPGTTCSAREAIDIGTQLCSALTAVHDAGLLHGDVKATNVMRAADGRIVLMDFGAGQDAADRTTSELTGTPLYAAPEVFRGDPATVRSDVYSVGVLLYRLLTGDYPVRGASLRDVRLAHEQGARGRLRAERPDLAAAFVRVIERALDPDPARRFQSAADMGAALRALADRPARRRRALAAGLVLGLLAASLVWGLSRRDVSSAGMPPRLAVLPFATRGAPGDAALGVGLAHEVQRNLAHLEGLMLLSFNASPTFAAGGRALADVTSELQADLVVDGAVERRAEGLHVDARLVRTADQTELWRETFDRPDAEVFAILDEIARAIVDELRLELKLPRRHETSPDVFFLFLQAQAFQARRHENDSLEAARLFQQVVERDPSYAPAWAGLACALAEAHRVRAGDENRPPDPRMRHAAERAMELDPLLAPALTALGNVFAEDRNWARAEAAFRDAIAHNPSFTWAHTDYALTVLMPLNRADEALALLAEAISRDPASLDVRRVLAHFQVNAGLYEDAIATSRWVLARDPTFPWVDLWLGRALTLSGRPGEAVPIYAAQPSYWAYLGYAYAVMGRRDDAEALAASHDDPRGLMLIYSGLGETERAIQALQQLAAVNPWRAASWLHRPEMAPIRSDPRVAPIIRQLTGSD